jgi:hypothetical protein
MSGNDVPAAVNWPPVPACYGWLSLDRRGGWRLKGEPIRHAGLIAFINSHYAADDAGNCIFSNGPQRVYVSLDYTPLVWRLDGAGVLSAHTGVAAGAASGVWLDEDGSVLVLAESGIGLLDDRDLAAFLGACHGPNGEPAAHETLLGLMAGDSGVFWSGFPLQAITRSEVAGRFAFRPTPVPDDFRSDAKQDCGR